MPLLNWDGVDEDSLPDVIQNMRRVGALIEIVGMAGMALVEFPHGYDKGTAEDLVHEGGRLVERLGARALQLLQAQRAGNVRVPALKPRQRTGRERAA
jgi:hypothetical protein